MRPLEVLLRIVGCGAAETLANFVLSAISGYPLTNARCGMRRYSQSRGSEHPSVPASSQRLSLCSPTPIAQTPYALRLALEHWATQFSRSLPPELVSFHRHYEGFSRFARGSIMKPTSLHVACMGLTASSSPERGDSNGIRSDFTMDE